MSVAAPAAQNSGPCAWYSGWWNGHLKRHVVNIPRAKQGIHEVIEFCKARPGEKVVDAVDEVNKAQAGQ
jgi:hypothetical protein